jgi:ABC-2 type transport system ATP-binding protein
VSDAAHAPDAGGEDSVTSGRNAPGGAGAAVPEGVGAAGPEGAGATPSGGARPVLRVKGLGKRFDSQAALSGVSFSAHAGEMIAVIGPNGAGKTTLLSILAGVQVPSEGHVERRAPRVPGTTAVGWAPQQPALYSKLTVAENLRLFARLEGIADPEAAVARMLEQAGLGDRAHERLQRLSGGNRQRVNVALSLLADPPAILLDEPSSALDPGQRERLWSFVAQRAAAGTCVVFSTHIVTEAARHSGRVLVLDRGELLFDGAPALLLADWSGEAAEPGDVAERGDFEAAFVSFLRGRQRG